MGWGIVKGSESGHCCFEWSIVDELGEHVAEGWSDHAKKILHADDMYKMLQLIVDEAKGYQERTGNSVTWASEAELLLAKARGES